MDRVAALLDRCRGHASRPCIVDGELEHTYAELCAAVAHAAAEHEALGIEPGHVVALRADYSLRAVAVLLALLQRRAVVAMLPRNAELVRFAADACARHVLTVRSDGAIEHDTTLETRSHPLLDGVRGEGGIVLFTSGATGRPKAALQSADRFLRKFDRGGKSLRTLAFLMLDHVAGLDTLFYTLSAGGCLVLTRRRDPESILALVERRGVEVLPASPSFLRLLCATNAQDQYDLSSLRIVTYGSEPMDAATLGRLGERLPGVRLGQKYGTTETGSPRTVSRSDDSLWVKFADDPEVETEVRDGILWIRSPRTILGYLNAPSPVDADGWYCTGDLVDVDGEWLRFRGRQSEAINVGGEKVSPTEVERTILEVHGVADVAVQGEPHALLGQIVTARVLLQPELPAGEWLRRVRRHCAAHLPRYAVPVKIEVSEGPLSGDRHKKLRTPAR